MGWLPGSRFVAPGRSGELRTVPLSLRWEAGARVELQVPAKAIAGCTTSAALEGEQVRELPLTSEPGASTPAFAMPEPPASLPLTAALAVRWTCEARETPPELPWRRLSMRWERG